MATFDETETEEMLACIRMKVYHPHHNDKQVFRSISLFKRQKHKTDEVVSFGRDIKTCTYVLWDARASRVQFALQAFRQFNSSELSFEIKNMSRKTKLILDNMELSYLNKMELPSKCMLRFGDFQFLVEREAGESLEYFETYFELTPTSPLQEILIAPSLQPIPEQGITSPRLSLSPSPSLNSSWHFSRAETAEEVDENES
ncbi:TRAF-interacting protein with FHA domain-containing protein A-like [Ambystoma mexicanum]|uniref:TRAF-interacting protein with FHA domain-containing protein A-like n=1 Tax=Ambystoma mexicanum TaxID=8296 RepID=UPI0037E7E134